MRLNEALKISVQMADARFVCLAGQQAGRTVGHGEAGVKEWQAVQYVTIPDAGKDRTLYRSSRSAKLGSRY